VCPYCLIASENVQRFQSKYPNVHYDWKPWEILPEMPPEGLILDYGSVSPSLAKLAEEAGLWIRPPRIQPNSHLALMGLFYAHEHGKLEQYNDAVFKALWNEEQNIGELQTLSQIVAKAGLDSTEFKRRIETERERYAEKLEESERDAVKDNIQLAPTFVFREKQIVGNVSAMRVEKFIRHVATHDEIERSKR
jgi:predicted DsbA family dithiol-disulfide isomerase